MRLAPGTHLGSYEILSPLGAGGMGEVYRARDGKLRREVALKVLPEEVARDPHRLALFEREARMAAGLNHPNIVTLHSIEEAGGTRFITMELVNGRTLDQLIDAKGLPPKSLLEIAIALAEALAAAHEKGIVHRDLKPQNVMVTDDGRVKVMDFGLAKMAPERDGSMVETVDAISVSGQVVGTAPYMAPEQVRADAADARTDLFALGVILYEMASGRRPFAGRSFAELSSAILRDAPDPLASLRRDLPRGFDSVVNRCLEKDPNRRPQTAAEIRDELMRSQQTIRPERGAPSIAVLPFVNMSRDEENEYFSDGLSEELMNVLAKIPELKVTGRTSSFAFKGKKEDLRDIGQKLGVATLLEGSVRKAGNRVRITAQLIKASDGFHLWSETYDRVLDDIFAVQDDIARSVSQALHVTLLGGARPAPKAGAEVFPLVLQANHLRGQNSGPALERAVALYREVIAKSPDNAPAWAGLSLARLYQGGYGHAPLAECIQEAKAAADRALELDDGLAAAHDAKGVILASYDFRFREGVQEVRKAVRLAPGASGPMITLSMYEGALGSMSEALRLARRAQEIDPLSADTHANRGRVEVWARNWEAASEAYQRSLELSPNAARTYSSLGMIYLHRGMGEKAIETILKEVSPGYRYFTLAVAYHELGRKKESDEAMARVLEESEDWGTQFASAHAARGEIDQAFHWLERSYELHDTGIVMLKVNEHFRHLHGDPRWPRLLEKIGLGS